MSKIICLDISVLNDKNRTGVGVYTYELINALLKLNKEDRFILFGFSTLQTYDFLKNIEFKNYPNVELKIIRQPAKLFRTSFLLWQKINWPKIENFVGPIDIFHSFNWNLPPVKNGKIVATIFDMTPHLLPNLHLGKTIELDRVRLNRIKNLADLVVTISENSKKDFLRFAPEKKVEVIYPGVSEAFLQRTNENKEEEILNKYNLKTNYVLSVGTIEPRKNIKFLINAYLRSEIKEKLVLVGNWGWEGSEVSDLIKKNKERIVITGYIPEEELPYLYKNSLVFVYPSFYEGFGIPILEAMNSQTSVITSNTSSLTEVGGEAVVYIDPNDLNSLISALRKILDKEFRNSLIKKGLRQAKKFSWEVSAKKLNLLYQRL